MEEKNPPDPNPGGQKANQNIWTNSKHRANIKINTRKYGYVHVKDLHKQMNKGGGRRGKGGAGELNRCKAAAGWETERNRNWSEQKRTKKCTLEKIPSCIWISEGRQS
jgi:hypothetical protein